MRRLWLVGPIMLLLFEGLACLTLGGRSQPPSPAAVQYIDTAFAIVRAHGLAQEEVDWAGLRQETLRRAAGAHTPADTHKALRWLLKRLNRHSLLLLPEFWAELQATIDEKPPLPEGRMLEGGIAYLSLPGMLSSDSLLLLNYARTGQRLIRSFRDSGACGWIVDLRANTGGNVRPMLIAVGPLLGDGPAGFTRAGVAMITVWGYEDGKFWAGRDTVMRLPRGDTVTARVQGPIAVLLGPRTASAGEAIAIAFQGLDGMRTFGAPTAGLTTGNRGYRLSDGAYVILTEAVMGDRLAREYGHELDPDQHVGARWWNEMASPVDPLTTVAAANWLRHQEPCSARR